MNNMRSILYYTFWNIYLKEFNNNQIYTFAFLCWNFILIVHLILIWNLNTDLNWIGLKTEKRNRKRSYLCLGRNFPATQPTRTLRQSAAPRRWYLGPIGQCPARRAPLVNTDTVVRSPRVVSMSPLAPREHTVYDVWAPNRSRLPQRTPLHLLFIQPKSTNRSWPSLSPHGYIVQAFPLPHPSCVDAEYINC